MKNVANPTLSPEVNSLKSEIHRLENRLQQFRTRQDSWNEWYLGLGLTTIIVATLLGGFSLFCQRKASNIELSSRPFAEELGRKNVQLRSLIDQQAQLEVTKAQTAASDASTRAENANERALKAQGGLAVAEQHSAEANAKAEGFRLNIAKANESAAQAQAQVAGAMAEAAKANLELARIKAPRTLAISADTLSALRAFPGTEYTFSMAAADPESVDFLKQIDAALQSVGWKRVAPDPAPAIGINVFGDEYRVTIGTLKGVKVEVGCTMSAEELQAIPPASWPLAVKLAGGIRNAIASFTSPVSDENIHPSVEVTKGLSEVVRISVGSKP